MTRMNEERVTRKLAAVLAADIVNYSGMMSENEVATRARLNQAFEAIVFPAIENHQGRLIKTMGDGLLAEFVSVVDAVDSAIAMQKGLAEAEGGETNPLRLRIGINLGDIIVEGDDIHGNGVNIAARIEALAPAGGICISRTARDQIRDQPDYTLDDLGEVEVKNIGRPVRVFQVQHADLPTVPAQPKKSAKRSPRRWIIAAAACALLIGAGVLWLEPWSPSPEKVSEAEMMLPLPDRPSIAVLPFNVTSKNDGDLEFANALNEDLTRGLARVSGLFVISRSSTLQFVGETATPARVARELGVRYIVRASMRRSGNRVRIDGHLTDALSGRIVWSDRLDRSSADLFELQDDLVQALASRLVERLVQPSDQSRFTENVAAYFLWAEGDQESWINTPESYGKARALALEALDRDPGFVRARALLAFLDTQTAYFRVVENREEVQQRALTATSELVALEPTDWYVHAVHAQALMNNRDYEVAAIAFDKAIELEPANANLLTRSTLPLIFLGKAREAEARLRVSMRLNPYHGWLPDQILGQSLYVLERYEEAIESLEKAHRKNPRFIGNLWWRAAAYGQLGRTEEGMKAISELIGRVPDASIANGFIKITDKAAMARFEDGLRAAGMPE